jgi:hypothetical protein
MLDWLPSLAMAAGVPGLRSLQVMMHTTSSVHCAKLPNCLQIPVETTELAIAIQMLKQRNLNPGQIAIASLIKSWTRSAIVRLFETHCSADMGHWG